MQHSVQRTLFNSPLGTVVLTGIAVFFVGALMVGVHFDRQDQAQRDAQAGKAVSRYLQVHHCAGINTQKGDVTDFRCENPGPAYYLTAQEMRVAARAEALYLANRAAPSGEPFTSTQPLAPRANNH